MFIICSNKNNYFKNNLIHINVFSFTRLNFARKLLSYILRHLYEAVKFTDNVDSDYQICLFVP